MTCEQAHYPFGVMRLSVGRHLVLLNGQDGEWDAEVADAGKRGIKLSCMAQSKPLQLPPNRWPLFAPTTKARTDFIFEKAAELDSARTMPV